MCRGERDQRLLKRPGKLHERGGLRPVPCASPPYIAYLAILAKHINNNNNNNNNNNKNNNNNRCVGPPGLKYLHAVTNRERSLPGLTPHSHLAGFCIVTVSS